MSRQDLLFENDEFKIKIEKLSERSDDWKTVKSELYKPDRDEFIYSNFIVSYPKLKDSINNADMVYKLASRSKKLNEWLSITNSKYALEVAPPLWLKDEIDPKTYKDVTNSLKKINDIVAEKADREKELSEKYKNDLELIKKEFDSKVNKIKTSNYIKILSLNSQSLPITLQLMIESYTPAKVDESPTAKTYAREILTKFKIELIRYTNNNPDVDIDTIINQLMGE